MYAADYHVHSTCSPDGKMTMSQAAEAFAEFYHPEQVHGKIMLVNP